MSTTIALSPETRNQLKEFGDKGETYDQIVGRLLKSARDRQIAELLMDERGTITIDAAIAKAKKRWLK